MNDEVTITKIDMSIMSMSILMVKFVIAVIPAAILLIIISFMVSTVLMAFGIFIL